MFEIYFGYIRYATVYHPGTRNIKSIPNGLTAFWGYVFRSKQSHVHICPGIRPEYGQKFHIWLGIKGPSSYKRLFIPSLLRISVNIAIYVHSLGYCTRHLGVRNAMVFICVMASVGNLKLPVVETRYKPWSTTLFECIGHLCHCFSCTCPQTSRSSWVLYNALTCSGLATPSALRLSAENWYLYCFPLVYMCWWMSLSTTILLEYF